MYAVLKSGTYIKNNIYIQYWAWTVINRVPHTESIHTCINGKNI